MARLLENPYARTSFGVISTDGTMHSNQNYCNHALEIIFLKKVTTHKKPVEIANRFKITIVKAVAKCLFSRS